MYTDARRVVIADGNALLKPAFDHIIDFGLQAFDLFFAALVASIASTLRERFGYPPAEPDESTREVCERNGDRCCGRGRRSKPKRWTNQVVLLFQVAIDSVSFGALNREFILQFFDHLRHKIVQNREPLGVRHA